MSIEPASPVSALDTTYIPMARGFVYLTAVVDVASRKVLAHKVAITLEACHAREVMAPMASPNSPTRGHPKFPQVGRPDYDDTGVMAMRAAASLSR